MLGVFNGDEFAYLLRKAMGNRSINSFAKTTGVSANNISLLLRKKMIKSPRVNTIEKFAAHAENGITLNDFLMAAGLLSSPEQADYFQNNFSLEKEKEVFTLAEIQNAIPIEKGAKYQDLVNSVAKLALLNNISADELEDLLVMLRALRKSDK